MVSALFLKAVVPAAFVALALGAGAATASAQPDTALLVNTTCTYDQVVRALNAERPDLAGDFNSSPIAQSTLGQFLAAPPPARQQMIDQGMSSPYFAAQIGPMLQLGANCSKY